MEESAEPDRDFSLEAVGHTQVPPELWEGWHEAARLPAAATDTASAFKALLLGENMKGGEKWDEEHSPFLCIPVSSQLIVTKP